MFGARRLSFSGPSVGRGIVPQLMHRDAGGGLTDSTSGGIAPSAQSANPMMQAQVQRYAALPTETLQELQVRAAGTQQGQLIQRILQQRQMAPNATDPAISGATQPAANASATASAGPALANGGPVHRDMGGSLNLSQMDPWWTRTDARETASVPQSGMLHSTIPGRTDQIAVNAPAGAYVVPADVVSGLGEGNSLAGARVMDAAMRSGPWGTGLPPQRRGSGPPRPPAIPHQMQARGGKTKPVDTSRSVPVLMAGGEYVIHPRDVARVGGGDITRGHKILDRWVVHERKRIATKMMKLPGPVKE